MSEQSEVRPPAGQSPSQSAELGEPERDLREARDEAPRPRPDLDERERRISERRKPAGPPLEEAPGRREEGAEAEAGSEERPVDPA